jgi:hypothetical protein
MDENTEQQIIARLDYIERYLVNLGQVSGWTGVSIQEAHAMVRMAARGY